MICELDRVVGIKPLFTKGYKVSLNHILLFFKVYFLIFVGL